MPATQLRLLTIGILLLAGSLAFATVSAKTQKETQQQLKEILLKIDKLKQVIAVKEDSKSKYLGQLRSIETDIGQVSQLLERTNKSIGDKRKRLRGLAETRTEHQQQLSRENESLAEQVYTAYTLGQQERIKLLFSQKQPQQFQRNLVYYQYFSNARADLIESVESSIAEIISTESLINTAKKDLEKTGEKLQSQKTQLTSKRSQRRSIVANLERQLKNQSGELDQLSDEAKELQYLLESIQEIFIDAPPPPEQHKPFPQMKGKLAWPVEGKLRNLYGRLKPGSDLRWQGVMLQAPGGRQVRAISSGRVAFADWMRGFGNLLIIDHGDTYLSLYGHNESLYKSAGEWVDPGEVIGSVGDSGGQQKPGLYLEIRKNGKPQNPTRWFQRGKFFTG